VTAAWEKGKVERAIGYVRQNFWPLRSFIDLADVNAQAGQWPQEIANQRRHRETGQAPNERFQSESLRQPARHGWRLVGVGGVEPGDFGGEAAAPTHAESARC
jgi:hypothetical protein